jgi:hypothetical protein
MAFRKKADFILTYNPDILIVPECENPDKLLFSINHGQQYAASSAAKPRMIPLF